jgi:hypothetical protein
MSRWRHNWEKYQKRRTIRNEWKRRLDIANRNGLQPEYARVVTEYWIVTCKIRRYYAHSGRMC